MRGDVIQRLGLGALVAIRNNPRFPHDTGHLKQDATGVSFIKPNSFTIYFDKTIAHYIPYLEYGTKRSTKHVGFISQRATQDIIDYLGQVLNRKVLYTMDLKDSGKKGGLFND